MKYAVRDFLWQCLTVSCFLVFILALAATVLAVVYGITENPWLLLGIIVLIPAMVGSWNFSFYCARNW